MRRLIIVIVSTLASATLAAGCFKPSEPPCSFVCANVPDLSCPEDYTCQSDGYCHLNGNPAVCSYSDAAAAPTDLRAADLAH